MPLNLIHDITTVKQKLKEVKEDGLFYAGELVFASPVQTCNKIDPHGFNLQDLPYADKLDRIIMLFTSQGLTLAAMVVITKGRVSYTGVQDAPLQLEAYRGIQSNTDSMMVESGSEGEISRPVRLIYSKPLFLTLLYRHNMLREGLNQRTICNREVVAEQKKDLAFYEKAHNMLTRFYNDGSWMREFPALSVPFHSETLACALARYLDGLYVMQQLLCDPENEEGVDLERALWKSQYQDIEDMICLLRKRLSQLPSSLMRAVPFPAPEATIALWRCDETFDPEMRFGELICIRTELEQMRCTSCRTLPEENNERQDKLREYRENILRRQLQQVDSMLEDKMGQGQLDWEAYLGDL